jgi:uncharacterized protein (TIGR02996 family)
MGASSSRSFSPWQAKPLSSEMANMDTEAALRRAVWEEPYDDDVRLVYADWLMETGDPEKARRGEFVQVQVELSRLTEEDPARPALERRERQLFRGRSKAWRAEVPRRVRAGVFERGFFQPWPSVDLQEFLAWPDELFEAAPLWHIFQFVGDWNRNRTLWPRLGEVRHLWRLNPLCLRFRLGPADVATLAGWSVLSRLRGLDLSHNRIGSEGAAALPSSPYLTALERLSLGRCEIGSAGAAVLAASPHLGRLRDLNLDNCRVGDAGALAIVNSPNLPSLRRLNLTANDITPEGAVGLAASPGLQRLVRLGLSYNAIGDAGAIALAESPYLKHLQQMILWFPSHGLELSASPGFNRRSALVLQGVAQQLTSPGEAVTERGMRVLHERFTEIRDEPHRGRR